MDGVSKPTSQSVYSAIKTASQETGADFDYLWRTAKRESSLNPEAKAQTSSATGLFQFTNDTWLRMVDRYGEKHGVADAADDVSVLHNKVHVADPGRRDEILAMRTDPELSARMAGELANENAELLGRKIDRAPTEPELYVAHFLGVSDAGQLIKAAEAGETRAAADMFPRAAAANQNIFYEASGAPRSVNAVYARLTGETIGEATTPKSEAPMQLAGFAPSSDPFADLSQTSGAKLASGMLFALFDLQSKLGEDER